MCRRITWSCDPMEAVMRVGRGGPMRQAFCKRIAVIAAILLAIASPLYARAAPGFDAAMMTAMSGMNAAMMSAPMTGNPDRHHVGAVDMVTSELEHGHDMRLRRLAPSRHAAIGDCRHARDRRRPGRTSDEERIAMKLASLLVTVSIFALAVPAAADQVPGAAATVNVAISSHDRMYFSDRDDASRVKARRCVKAVAIAAKSAEAPLRKG